jgi:cellulose synthase/poly-beta-1,6-N-acetylglucosamine synthase-like glycosyltransferase
MARWDNGKRDGNGLARPNRARPEAEQRPNLPAFLGGPASSHAGNDNHRYVFDEGPAEELDCLRSTFAPELLRRAERRAKALGIGADQVLIKWGVIDEMAYLDHLSAHTGFKIETLEDCPRQDLLLADSQLRFAAEYGLMPLRKSGELIWVLAPRRLAARRLCQLAARDSSINPEIRLTTATKLQQFLVKNDDAALADMAAQGLARQRPAMSAAPASIRGVQGWRRFKRAAIATGLILVGAMLAVYATKISTTLLAMLFLAFVGLRLLGAVIPRQPLPPMPRLRDDRLPTYTVVAALYREAASVASLMKAIAALDYPREKLDIILVTEPNDLKTRVAIAHLGPMPHVRVLIAPLVGPQTKPKALNCALPFAQGGFLAVFDAEDRPDPNQLRAAVDAFCVHDNDIACVQACLCIDNASDSWLTRMFSVEYAGQFDIFLPGLSALKLPLPLGGSSNHFRTAVLREVGGWDAYNVTEDADLGFRLSRFGYRSVAFASTTFEEAPIRFSAWIRQRSRWMKGWMQTWLVHMRNPLQLRREAGLRGVLTLNILVGGSVLTALAYPVLLAAIFAGLTSGGLDDIRSLIGDPLALLHITAIASGIVSTITIGLLGLARRGNLRRGWILAWTPIYWGYLSLAAWRALIQLLLNPYHWEKTEHGLTKRRSDPATNASAPINSAAAFRDNVSDRPQPLPASA